MCVSKRCGGSVSTKPVVSYFVTDETTPHTRVQFLNNRKLKSELNLRVVSVLKNTWIDVYLQDLAVWIISGVYGIIFENPEAEALFLTLYPDIHKSNYA